MNSSANLDQALSRTNKRRKGFFTVDRSLVIIGLSCQVILAVVAISAYFLTVVPIQQKDLLTKNLAELQHEFNETSALLSQLHETNSLEAQRLAELQAVNAKFKNVNLELVAANSELDSKNLYLAQQHSNIQRENDELKSQSTRLQAEISQKTTRVTQLNETVSSSDTRIFLDEMATCCRIHMSESNNKSLLTDLQNNMFSQKHFKDVVRNYLSTFNPGNPANSIIYCLNGYADEKRFLMSLIPLNQRKDMALKLRRELGKRPDLWKASVDKSVIDEIVLEMFEALEKIALSNNDPGYRIEESNIARPFLDKISAYEHDMFLRDIDRAVAFFGVEQGYSQKFGQEYKLYLNKKGVHDVET